MQLEILKRLDTFRYNGIKSNYTIYRETFNAGDVWSYEWMDSRLNDHYSQEFTSFEVMLAEIANREKFDLDETRENLTGWAEVPTYTIEQILEIMLQKIEIDTE